METTEKLTKKEIKKVHAKYPNQTQDFYAEKLGVHRRTYGRALKREGIRNPKRRNIKQPTINLATTNIKDAQREIVRAVVKANPNNGQRFYAEMLGVPLKNVSEILKDAEVSELAKKCNLTVNEVVKVMKNHPDQSRVFYAKKLKVTCVWLNIFIEKNPEILNYDAKGLKRLNKAKAKIEALNNLK